MAVKAASIIKSQPVQTELIIISQLALSISRKSFMFAKRLCFIIYAVRIAANMQLMPTRTIASKGRSPISAPTTMLTQESWKNWLRSPQNSESSSEEYTANTCGFSGTVKWTCVDTLEVCTNTVLSDGHAYQYCSAVGGPSQTYDTAVYDYYSGWTYSSWPQRGVYWCVSMIIIQFLTNSHQPAIQQRRME